MADPTESDEPASGESENPQERNWRKLEDRAKLAEEKAARYERELAFTRARLDHLNDDQAAALAAVHKGDMTADALKATAERLGFAATEPAPTPVVEPDRSGEAAELSALAGSTAEPSGGPGPVTQEAVDKTIRGFDNPAELRAWIMDNRGMFDPTE